MREREYCDLLLLMDCVTAALLSVISLSHEALVTGVVTTKRYGELYPRNFQPPSAAAHETGRPSRAVINYALTLLTCIEIYITKTPPSSSTNPS